jgi:hypothetical protein
MTVLIVLAVYVVSLILAHQDGKRVGREQGLCEAEARRRHPSNQPSNVRVRNVR